MSVGALSHFGFAPSEAASPSDLVAISKFFDPASADISDKFPLEPVPTMNQNRAQRRSRRNIREVGGNFTTPGFFEVLPWFFLFGLGNCVTSETPVATGLFKHTFSPVSGALPSFCAETEYFDVGAIQAYGCKVDNLNFKAEPGSELEVSCDFIGVGTEANAAATVTNLPGDDCVAQFAGASVKFGSVEEKDVMSIELGIANNLERIATLNGTAFIQRIREKHRALSLGMDMDFVHMDHYDRAMAADWIEVELLFTGENAVVSEGDPVVDYFYQTKISLPRVGFSSAEAPISADGIISQKVEALPLYSPTDLHDISIEVINEEANYPIPSGT